MAKPRFSTFQRIGNFLVTNYLGSTQINPRNGRTMADPQHWYRVRCTCGHVEQRSQQELRDTRRIQACESCRRHFATKAAA